MKNFSGPRLAIDVSIRKNRLQGAVTSIGMIVIAVIFCLSAFPFPLYFSKCQLGERVLKQFVIQFNMNTKRTI